MYQNLLLSFFTYLWSCFTVKRNLSAADFFQCFFRQCDVHYTYCYLETFLEKNRSSLRSPFFLFPEAIKIWNSICPLPKKPCRGLPTRPLLLCLPVQNTLCKTDLFLVPWDVLIPFRWQPVFYWPSTVSKTYNYFSKARE